MNELIDAVITFQLMDRKSFINSGEEAKVFRAIIFAQWGKVGG